MALDFLSNVDSSNTSANPLGVISQLLNLGGQGLQLNNTLKGYQPVAAEGAQNQALGLQGQALSNQNALLQALTDPNSTIYKNMVAGQQQQLNGQTQQRLRSLLEMNRKAQLMGRGQFFNPERQDEAVSQYLGNEATNNATNARSNALNQIITAANGYGSNASGYGSNANIYGNMVKNQQAAQAQNNSATSSALNQGSNILSQFGNGGSMANLGTALMGMAAFL